MGISVFSRPDTGCIVKGQDRAERSCSLMTPTSGGWTRGSPEPVIGARGLKDESLPALGPIARRGVAP